PGGGQDELELVVAEDEFDMPNGLCFSPDESLLYINDTTHAHIKVFDVGADGSLSNGRLFAENIGDGDLAKGGLVDGMKCDERGNIWVTGPSGVWVFSSGGEHLGVVEIPESVGNLHRGGPDWNWMFVPASTSLYNGVKDTKALERGTWGAAPADGLEPQDGDLVVEKMRMSGWHDTRLESLLIGLHRFTIIITGAWTNMSIEHTARTGADKGYE